MAGVASTHRVACRVAGPGSITSVMILIEAAKGSTLTVLAAIAAVLAVDCALKIGASLGAKYIGVAGTKVMAALMGCLLSVRRVLQRSPPACLPFCPT
eukprot:SAG11_NODE_5501_length_1543_cov_2.661357_2_plen_98_part_00